MTDLSAFSKHVRPEVPGCPEVLIEDAILRAAIEFCARTKVLRENITVTTVVNQAAYVLTTSTDTVPDEILAVRRAGSDDLEPSSYDDFEVDQITDQSGTPSMFYMTEGGDLVLGATPGAIETLTAVVKVRPSETATTLPADLYDGYAYEIGQGAKAKLMLMANKAWTNPQGAAISRGIFDAAIDDANLKTAKGGSRKPLRTEASFF